MDSSERTPFLNQQSSSYFNSENLGEKILFGIAGIGGLVGTIYLGTTIAKNSNTSCVSTTKDNAIGLTGMITLFGICLFKTIKDIAFTPQKHTDLKDLNVQQHSLPLPDSEYETVRNKIDEISKLLAPKDSNDMFSIIIESSLISQLDQIQKAISSHIQSIEESKSEAEKLKNELETTKQDIQSSKKLEQKIKNLEEELERKEKDVENFIEKQNCKSFKELEEKIKDLEEQLEYKTEEIETLEISLTHYKSQLYIMRENLLPWQNCDETKDNYNKVRDMVLLLTDDYTGSMSNSSSCVSSPFGTPSNTITNNNSASRSMTPYTPSHLPGNQRHQFKPSEIVKLNMLSNLKNELEENLGNK